MSVWALLSTVLGFDGDVECALLLANSSITVAAIGALLVAVTEFAPFSFAVNGAWVISTRLVFDVLLMFAFAAAMLSFNMNDELSRLTATTTG